MAKAERISSSANKLQDKKHSVSWSRAPVFPKGGSLDACDWLTFRIKGTAAKHSLTAVDSDGTEVEPTLSARFG